MITTLEARLAAEAWLCEEAGRYPELVGAVLAGSTRTRYAEEPHPPGSDVDLFIYVDAEVPSEILEPHGRFAPRKLAFRGVVLEPSFHNTRRIADPEAVLGDMHLAPVFAEPLILLDPYGRLVRLAKAVKPEFLRRRHAQRRLEQALGWGHRPRRLRRAPSQACLRSVRRAGATRVTSSASCAAPLQCW